VTRGTPLVTTVARVVAITGVQGIPNLETGAGGALTATDLLLVASDAIYDELVNDGHTPEDLTNSTSYESAVAWQFVARLVIGGYIPQPVGQAPPANEQGQADPFAWSDPYYSRVKPKYAPGEPQGRVREGVPVLKNVSTRPLFGGQLS
jgi:hypothetical protein